MEALDVEPEVHGATRPVRSAPGIRPGQWPLKDGETQVTYVPAADRYDVMEYRRCSSSGLRLPMLSLGLWQNLCRAVLDLFIASARGLAFTALEHRQLAQMRAARMAQTPDSLTA